MVFFSGVKAIKIHSQKEEAEREGETGWLQ
jgi:hypothetical protein